MPQPQKGKPPAKKPDIPDYTYIDTADALHTAVHQLRQQPLWITRTIDTETTGCQAFLHRLKVIQIGVAQLPIYVIQIERIPQSEWGPLREYLAEPRPNLLQNAKFDLKMLSAEGLPLSGAIRDTIIRSKLYHLGNRRIKHDLKALALKWCNLDLDKDQQTSFVADETREPLNQKQKDYAAIDISTTTQVEEKLTVEVENRERKQPGILAHVTREERFLPLLANLENQGVLVNLSAVQTLEQEIKARMEVIETALDPILRPNLKQLKLNFKSKTAFSPTKLAEEQVQTAFQLEDAKTQTLLKATQKQPLAKLALQHESLWRQLGCCKELPKKLSPVTGRWHPDHAQIENLQGSLGPSKLKIELLERLTTSWRQAPLQLLQPDRGYVFLKVSFPELELTLLAHHAKETLLQKELASGESPVKLLAAAIATAGLSVEGYDDSFLATALWHGVGVLNQRGVYLQAWFYSECNVILVPQQVKALQALIPARYPALAPFHASLGKSYYGFRATILGALRLWDEASPKDARNFMVWSSFSELLKECVSYLQPCCTSTNSRVACIGEQSLLLEVPSAVASEMTEAVLTELIEKISQHFPLAIAVEVTPVPK